MADSRETLPADMFLFVLQEEKIKAKKVLSFILSFILSFRCVARVSHKVIFVIVQHLSITSSCLPSA